MYVYRVMSSCELVNRMNGINTNDTLNKGINTFKYERGTDYIHFYKFPQHAFINCHMFGLVVAKVKLDDDIVPPLEYGFYSGIKTDYDDSLSSYSFPIPEIVIDRRLFSNDCIVTFSNKFTKSFEEYEDGSYPLSFIVNKKNFFGIKKIQEWDMHAIYYEYIKSLFPLFDYSGIRVGLYLKTVDLDKELMIMAERIKNESLIIKKRKRRFVLKD